jgi:hypothetical protein
MSEESNGDMFSHKSYRDMLTQFCEFGYKFHFFDDAKALIGTGIPFVLLRHDIDLALHHASPLAEIEEKLGIRSTFFIQVRGDFYNPFCDTESQIIANLISAGHRIGLHFDCGLYPVDASPEDVAVFCFRERRLLETWFDIDVRVVSFHRPSKSVLSTDESITGGLPHTYLPIYTKEITYCSDSTGKWRFGHPLDLQATAERRPIQLLVHPIWWQSTNQSPQETLDMFLRQSRQRRETDLTHSMDPHRDP